MTSLLGGSESPPFSLAYQQQRPETIILLNIPGPLIQIIEFSEGFGAPSLFCHLGNNAL